MTAESLQLDKRSSGLTLTELLVVIAILGILMGLLFPAVGAARRRATRARCQVEVERIKEAFLTYELDYETWPTELVGYDDPGQPWNSNGLENLTGIEMLASSMAMFGGQNVSGMNPSRNRYLTLRPKQLRNDGAFADPWGNPYKYMCDFNRDDIVHVEFTGNSWHTDLVEHGVAVWSRGPDQSDEAGYSQDDVTSW